MPLIQQLQQFASESATTPQGRVQFRRAHAPGHAGPVTHVLLHGIGSASGNWLAQLQAAIQSASGASHVLAWDAPGYGDSDALPSPRPTAADYATRMWAWLDALGAQVVQPITLVGHSLGALMAASASAQATQRVQRLVLLAPAQGYGNAEPALREKKLSDRLDNLSRFGPLEMARRRAAAMLSPAASDEQRAFVQHIMARIHVHGYTQAAYMLAGGNVAQDLARVDCAITVASGSADGITPPAGCQALARDIGTPYVDLGAVGHSCALEAGAAVNALLGLGQP
ncbi:MAG: alpha/beta hydrolase [Burkholderiaceae bacterium]